MKLNESIISAFSDNSGGLSSLRIIVFMIVAVVLFNWTYVNIETSTFTSLNWQDVGVIVLPLVAKAWQRGKENDPEEEEKSNLKQ